MYSRTCHHLVFVFLCFCLSPLCFSYSLSNWLLARLWPCLWIYLSQSHWERQREREWKRGERERESVSGACLGFNPNLLCRRLCVRSVYFYAATLCQPVGGRGYLVVVVEGLTLTKVWDQEEKGVDWPWTRRQAGDRMETWGKKNTKGRETGGLKDGATQGFCV